MGEAMEREATRDAPAEAEGASEVERPAAKVRTERRAKVRRVLIKPLDRMGMRRRGTVAEHDAAMTALADRLGYMTEPGLVVVRDHVEGIADGPRKDRWPPVISVVNFARTVEAPPPQESRLVPSYMGSRAGREAWEEGEHVAVMLLRFLEAKHRPPFALDWSDAIRDGAAELRRKLERCRRRVGDGEAADGDVAELDAWERDRERARGLIFGEAVE